jgi:RNA polymerase-binding transcription factor DksA
LCSSHYQQARAAGILDQLAPKAFGPCQRCGKPIPPGRRYGAKFCSMDCKQKSIDEARHEALVARRAVRERNCAWCRVPLSAEKRFGTRFCSLDCDDKWHREQKRLAMLRAKKAARRACEVCGKPIPTSRRGNAIYCSPEHKLIGNRSGSPKARRNQQSYNRQYLYGITSEEFDAMLASQGGGCAICGTTDWLSRGKGPHTDHDPDRGPTAVRGILCGTCNNGLGNFGDDPARLRAAADYLERTRVPS